MLTKYKNLFTRYLQHHKKFLKSELDNRILHNRLDLDVAALHSTVHQQAVPIFVLSTGRCGTKLLSELIEMDRLFEVVHQPAPELTFSASYAYQKFGSKFEELSQIIDACRYEKIRDCYLLNKTFVETNNRITFFAPYLKELFPKSKFIHLQREVQGFVVSGFSRNWYAYEKLFDEGRITPRLGSKVPWFEYNQVQKITWLWKETNDFIRKTIQSLPDSRKFFLQSEDLYHNAEKITELLSFIGAKPVEEEMIRRRIAKPINAQSKLKKLTDQQKLDIAQILE